MVSRSALESYGPLNPAPARGLRAGVPLLRATPGRQDHWDGAAREQPNPSIPADWQDKVLHARIEIGTTVLMGADIPQAEPMRSAYLTLSLDREEDAEGAYALLADGGEIFMKIEKTTFANRFAMLRDRFGTSWMLLHQPESK